MQTTNRLGDRDDDRSVHESHIPRMVAHYREAAKRYNSEHFGGEDYGHNIAVHEMLAIMRATNSKTLLDVCCGTGRGVKAALENGFEAVGVDVSPDLLKCAHTQTGIPEERLRQADATQLPFADNSFDVACIFGALHHTAMPTQIVNEMIRVSRRAIVISDEGNHLHGGFKRILIKMGLFGLVYRLIFRRAPRQGRRQKTSEGDGPTFDFSIEEIIPLLKERFTHFKCLTNYKVGKFQIRSYRVPRLFAWGGIVTVWDKRG
jgi:ubiquinone/menaquinone biosynthesis C-methylase UbiE